MNAQIVRPTVTVRIVDVMKNSKYIVFSNVELLRGIRPLKVRNTGEKIVLVKR